MAARRFAFLLVGDAYLAEDVVQEAFVRIIGRLRHIRDPDAFSQYLRIAIVNVTRSHFRRRRLERKHERLQMERHSPVLDPPDLGDEDRMRHALLRISPRQRAAIVLRYYEDRSESQIAMMLECREGTVRSLLSRGIAELRELIRGEENE